MPALRRVKSSEAVADYLLGEFTAGRLKPGDRIDLDAVANELGVSRAPVREALVLLERDGTVRMPFHRGAFLGDINAERVREGVTLYALLSGLTAQLAAPEVEGEYLDLLGEAVTQALAATNTRDYEQHAREFRRLINRRVAGPHLRAMLRTFVGLVVAVSSVAVDEDLAGQQKLLEEEFEALQTRDPATAARAAIKHIRQTGEQGLDVLVQRGIIAADHNDDDFVARRLPSIEALLTTMTGGQS
ncbi:GntR family transcriptional regulator [Enemella sp. A6]|uniref:GntR family transcriptional regulator n=1 Tax=Enemella sp. A6 TaxID=3440152 RepID=UPI003EBF59F1